MNFYNIAMESAERDRQKLDSFLASRKQLVATGTVSLSRVEDAFPEVFVKKFTRTSNLPPGVSLFQTLPFGDVPLVDIKAEDEQKFIARTGMTYQSFLPFAEAGLVVPINYEPNSEKWRSEISFSHSNERHLKDILEISFNHAYRIRRFCIESDPEFDDVELQAREIFESMANKGAVVTTSMASGPREFSKSDARAVSTRFAQLHALAPSLYEEMESDLNSVVNNFAGLDLLLAKIHKLKWWSISSKTASLGGNFIISSPMVERASLDEKAIKGTHNTALAIHQDQREAMEYVFKRITSSFGDDVLQANHAKHLSDFLVNDHNFELRSRINDLLNYIFELTYDRGFNRISESSSERIVATADQIHELISEYREELKSLRAVVKVLGESADKVDRWARKTTVVAPIFALVFPAITTTATGLAWSWNAARFVGKAVVSGEMIEQALSPIVTKQLGRKNAIRFLDLDEKFGGN